MTREIKFRCWNKVTATMHYPDWNELAVRARLTEMEFIQYTGLKDKNGVEIYEGDRVQWWNGRELVGDIKVVEATNGGWNPFIDDCQTDGSWHFIVIGNIYQNKELLK